MKFEASSKELKELIKLSPKEVENHLRSYSNIYKDIQTLEKADSRDPSFYIQYIPAGNRATMDFDSQRIRIWEGENGETMEVEIG